MTLAIDTTLVHMKALSAIDTIERNLETLRYVDDESRQSLRTTDRIAQQSVRLRRVLDEFFEREQLELFPRIRRICGTDNEEVPRLRYHQQQVLEALDRFITALSDGGSQKQATPEEHFQAFVECFDARCDVERDFYQTYSTILYPGGVATD